ncbi:Thiol peroxidase, Bcp-type [Enhygromyxa salina]|uniref:thioredoxin-dependent peroxiredoxin n=1 Tax=Enhygromyxa salina TaxID=215803 RepID=A0A0C2CQ40_9BACT|nr:Thiol peroxidase, Bcp-type [Enhygromyxa salina]
MSKKPATKKAASKKKTTAAKKTAATEQAAPAAQRKQKAAKPPGSDVSLAVGDAAPAFDLPADGGGRHSTSSLAGRRFVLYFYPRDNTPGCTTEAMEFTALASEFAQLGVVVIGVSTDSLESHAKFRAKHSLGVELLADTEYAASLAYGAWGSKLLYGKPVVGMIRTTFVVGPSGKIEAKYLVRKAAGHAAAVLADLRTQLDASPVDPPAPIVTQAAPAADEDDLLDGPQTDEDDEPEGEAIDEIRESTEEGEHDDQDELADDNA